MATSSAVPQRLLDFESGSSAVADSQRRAAAPLAEALNTLRSSSGRAEYLPDVPPLDGDVVANAGETSGLGTWVGAIGRAFRAADNGKLATVDDTVIDAGTPATVEVLDDGTVVMRVDGRVIVTGTDGDDTVDVQADGDGGALVTVNGAEVPVSAAEVDGITVRTNGGDDTISVTAGVIVRLTLDAGDGDDRINSGSGADTIRADDGDDRINAGDGDDRVDGGAGDDYVAGLRGADVVAAGSGDDVVYGGEDADVLDAAAGADYVDGFLGDDLVYGGSGADTLSGGRDDDTILGGAGDDVVYTGMGVDRAGGGGGDDTIYGQVDEDQLVNDGPSPDIVVYVEIDPEAGDAFVNVEGSDEFKERIYADLDTLRSSPVGQQMLTSLDESHEDTKAIAADWWLLGGPAYGGDVVTITEYTEENGRASEYGPDWLFNDLDISINPAYRGTHDGGVPITVLQHELGHAWDYTQDTIDRDTYEGVDPVDSGDVEVAERQATGLPIDHDDDPDTPEVIDPDHPYTYTENGLRDEMGRPHRDTYG